MSGFPVNLHVGQGIYPNELDIDQFPKTRQARTFRDRDEYVMSMMKDGALAPEGLDVSGVTIAGVGALAIPQVEARSGFSAANQSYSLNPDISAWSTGGAAAWRTMINNFFTIPALRRAFVTANFGYYKYNIVSRSLHYRIRVNGALAVQISLARDWRATSVIQIERINGTMTWAGNLPAGANSILLEFVHLGPESSPRAWHWTAASPTLNVFLI